MRLSDRQEGKKEERKNKKDEKKKGMNE